MAKLVFFVVSNVKEVSPCLPFRRSVLFIIHPRNSHFPSHKSTVSEVTIIIVFDTVSFGLIDLTVVGNNSHQFC